MLASAYEWDRLVPWGEGEGANSGTALGVCGVSKRRAGWELTAKRGEGAANEAEDEAEGRREAWYDGRCECAAAAAAGWKAVEGEGGAERVGEDVVSIAVGPSASASREAGSGRRRSDAAVSR